MILLLGSEDGDEMLCLHPTIGTLFAFRSGFRVKVQAEDLPLGGEFYDLLSPVREKQPL